ncbi:hypothetical protein ES703_118005 [subsurface metagenome]
MKSNLITLVQSKAFEGCGIMGFEVQSKVVDFQLAMDEAVRILGVEATGYPGDALVGTWGALQVAISFDPDDAVVAPNDDEQFCQFSLGFDVIGVTGGNNPSLSEFRDYSNVNLLTVRNLGIIVAAMNAYPWYVTVKVLYEKYKPTQNELVQLISRRR